MANDNINVRFRRVETLDGITGVQGTIYFVTSTNLIYVFNGESFEPYGESAHNKVTAISSSSTHQEYPSAKAVYDVIVENEEITASALTDLDSRINGINSEVLDLDSSKLSDAPVDGKTYGRRDGDWEEMVESISSETVSEESATSQFPYVEYTEQTLTDLQKTQVRTNIDAASASEVSELESKVGDLDDLDTEDKTSLVNAINEVKGSNPKVGTSIPSGGLLPNTLYNVGTLTGTVTINLATPTDNTIMNIYHICFETGVPAPTITWGSAITSWMGDSAPTINSNKHYEVNVLNGVAIAMEV